MYAFYYIQKDLKCTLNSRNKNAAVELNSESDSEIVLQPVHLSRASPMMEHTEVVSGPAAQVNQSHNFPFNYPPTIDLATLQRSQKLYNFLRFFFIARKP